MKQQVSAEKNNKNCLLNRRFCADLYVVLCRMAVGLQAKNRQNRQQTTRHGAAAKENDMFYINNKYIVSVVCLSVNCL